MDNGAYGKYRQGDIPTDCPVCSGQVDLHPFLQKERMT